jgi:hypothetical protein
MQIIQYKMKAISQILVFVIATSSFLLSGCNIYNILKYSNKEKYKYNSGFYKFKFYENQILICSNFANKIDLDMLFDLGATASCIFPDSAFYDVLSINKPISTPGKSVSADRVKVHRNMYLLGDITTRWFSIKNSFISSNIRPNIYPCNKVSGVWGVTSFSPYISGKGCKIVIINMMDTTLAIIDSLPSLKNWILIESNYNKLSSLFRVKINLGSESFYFLFDTGFSGNIVMTDHDFEIAKNSSKSFFDNKVAYGYIVNTLSGTRIDTAQIAYSKMSINNAIILDSIPIFSTKSISMNIVGMEFIKRFNVMVDYQHRKIYLQPNPNFRVEKASFYKIKGFSSRNTINSGFCIQNILVGSPAERAGLKIGDEIVSINSISTDNYDKCEIEKIYSNIDGNLTNNEIIVKRGDELLTFIL